MFNVYDRVLVYPVDRDSLPHIMSMENYPNIRLSRLISPASWGHEGEQYKCAEGLIEVSCDYEGALDDCSVVWIVNSWNYLNFQNFIEPAIRQASGKGKRIICSRDLTESEKNALSGTKISYAEYSSTTSAIDPHFRIQEIRTPIVYVMSSTEYCNQPYIETALCAEMRNRDYNVLLISSQKETSVYGEYTVPAFMFNNDYSENEKVLAMNRYVRKLEIKHQPDVIILGIPGAAMSYDYRLSTDFGIVAYEISEAVKPDFAILSSPCMLYDEPFFERIEKTLNNRLGVTVDIHTLSPYTLDFFAEETSLSFLSVDKTYVSEMIERIGYGNLKNLNDMTGISTVIDILIDELSEGSSSSIT